MSESPLFACVVPGRAPIFRFDAVAANKWTSAVGPAPESFVVFLTGAEPLPAGAALTVFLSRAAASDYTYMGCLTAACPSGHFRTPPCFLDIAFPVDVVLGLSLETEEAAQNLGGSTSQPQQQLQAATHLRVAQKVAKNLFDFVASYGRTMRRSAVVAAFPVGPGSVVSAAGVAAADAPWTTVTLEGESPLVASPATPAVDGAEEVVVLPASWVNTWFARLQTRMAKDLTFWNEDDSS